MRLHKLFEGYRVVPSIDRERYQERDGLEGPFRAANGKVYYYDPREGRAYDPDTDMYIDHEDYEAMNREVTESETDGATGPDYVDPEGKFVVVSDGDKFFSIGINQYAASLPLTDRGFRTVDDAIEDAEELLGEEAPAKIDPEAAKRRRAIELSKERKASDDDWWSDEDKPKKRRMGGSYGYGDMDESVNEEARDVIRDYMGMGYTRAEAEAEARRRYPEEFESRPRKQYNNTKPVLSYYRFYNVPAGSETEAESYGLKKTKSGKWAMAVYNTSGESTRFRMEKADDAFGAGKNWTPKPKNESTEEYGKSVENMRDEIKRMAMDSNDIEKLKKLRDMLNKANDEKDK